MDGIRRPHTMPLATLLRPLLLALALAAPAAAQPLALTTPAPNPARDHAALALVVHQPTAARVTLHDALGRAVAVVHDGALAAGEHRLTIDVTRLPPGLYVVRAEGGGQATVRRLAVSR